MDHVLVIAGGKKMERNFEEGKGSEECLEMNGDNGGNLW
jgi:hypothetical protein